MSGVTAQWVSFANTLSGDWSVAGHWTTGLVPTSTDDVAIGAGLTALVGFTVTATNEAAAALTLQTATGTLVVTGSFAVGGALSLLEGTLLDNGGTLSLGTLLETGTTAGNLLFSAQGGSIAVAGAVVGTYGTLVLDGAALSAPTIALQNLMTLAGTADVTADAMLQLGAEGVFGTGTVAAPGTLEVGTGSTLTAGSLQLLANSTLSIDATSAVAIDGAAAVAGALAVGSGATLIAPSGTIFGNLVLDGTLDAAAPFSGFNDPGTLLDVAGTLTGDGRLYVPDALGAPGTVELGNADSFAGSVSLDPGTELILDSGGLAALAAPVQFLDATIDLAGEAFGAGITPSYDAASGMLSVGTLTLDVGPSLSAGQFFVTADPLGNTEVQLVSTATWQASGGNPDGDRSDSAHWSGGQVPNGNFTASIGPGISASSWTVTAHTNQSALALALDTTTGTLELDDTFDLGNALTMQGGLLHILVATLDEGGAATLSDGAEALFQGGGSWLAGAVTIGESGTASAYRNFDVFALSSDTEQMPLSVLEAMGCALPVAATDVGDVAAMLDDANRRFVVAKDPAALAASLDALLADPAAARALGAANRARAEREFDVATMAAAYEALFAAGTASVSGGTQ